VTHPVAAGVDLEKLLTATNQRIEILLDSDYCLGHSYFLNIATLADLRHLFGKKIIPLLQEYFFNNFGKIGLVLGADFIKTKKI
jgi:5-methylcytosine-specific restriction protein B